MTKTTKTEAPKVHRINASTHPTIMAAAKQSTFTIGALRIKASKTRKEDLATYEPYVPAKHNPVSALRPGSQDAFKLPSRTFYGLHMPVHHAVEE